MHEAEGADVQIQLTSNGEDEAGFPGAGRAVEKVATSPRDAEALVAGFAFMEKADVADDLLAQTFGQDHAVEFAFGLRGVQSPFIGPAIGCVELSLADPLSVTGADHLGDEFLKMPASRKQHRDGERLDDLHLIGLQCAIDPDEVSATPEEMEPRCGAIEKLWHASDRRCGCGLLCDSEEMGSLAVRELIEPFDDREEDIIPAVDHGGDDEGAFEKLP